MTQAALTRNNPLHVHTVEWMADWFFDHHEDTSPNEPLTTYIDLCDKKDVFAIYINEMKIHYKDLTAFDGVSDHVDYDTFCNIWKNVFYWVKIRVYKSVSGKCWTCFEINDVRRSCEDKAVLLAAKRLHQLHRGGLYMLERKRQVKIAYFY